VLNEGWASFTHYYMMNRLWDKGLLSDGAMLEFYQLHSNVLFQPGYDSKYYSGLNPYYLGFEIFSEIRRICENPTAEDKKYFPELINQNWVDACLDAVANYRDESFVRQFLSPHLCRKLGLFLLHDDSKSEYVVKAIHDEDGFKQLRKSLANQYLPENYIPKLEITNVDYNTRKLSLTYYKINDRALSTDVTKVLKYLEYLWGFPVELQNSTL
jgi:spore cortex formation protein SpoVR/YcgB (stage V sporulation)